MEKILTFKIGIEELENKIPNELSNVLVNINRHLFNEINYVKKYNKLRKIHG